jgi:hypothetical protein
MRTTRRADNLAAICEPNAWKCVSLNLSGLYRDSFTFISLLDTETLSWNEHSQLGFRTQLTRRNVLYKYEKSLFSYIRSVHRIVIARDYGGFTSFQHPWISKRDSEMPSICIYVHASLAHFTVYP